MFCALEPLRQAFIFNAHGSAGWPPWAARHHPKELRMNMLKQETMLDIGKLVLGAFLFAAPWLYHFNTAAVDSKNAWVFGAVIVILSIAAIRSLAEWEEWIQFFLGLWLIVSPWALGFNADVAATWLHVGVGAVVALLAAIELWLVRQSPPHMTA
jgi:hypothetical protein